jgi:hypothetical protein
MANRFGEEYRAQHSGSNIFGMPAPMKRKPYERLNEDYNPQIRPANKRQWFDSGDREWLNTPSTTQSEGGIRRLQTQSYQADDERGSYIQKGANKKYNFEKKNNKYTEDGDNKKDKPNDKDSGGGSKVPRKPKPNTPSGGLKKPTPTKASK